jgi:hypothetical protein
MVDGTAAAVKVLSLYGRHRIRLRCTSLLAKLICLDHLLKISMHAKLPKCIYSNRLYY